MLRKALIIPIWFLFIDVVRFACFYFTLLRQKDMAGFSLLWESNKISSVEISFNIYAFVKSFLMKFTNLNLCEFFASRFFPACFFYASALCAQFKSNFFQFYTRDLFCIFFSTKYIYENDHLNIRNVHTLKQIINWIYSVFLNTSYPIF